MSYETGVNGQITHNIPDRQCRTEDSKR